MGDLARGRSPHARIEALRGRVARDTPIIGPHVRKNGGERTRQTGVGGGSDPPSAGLHGAPGLRQSEPCGPLWSVFSSSLVSFLSGVAFRKRSFAWMHGSETGVPVSLSKLLGSFRAKMMPGVGDTKTTTVQYMYYSSIVQYPLDCSKPPARFALKDAKAFT